MENDTNYSNNQPVQAEINKPKKKIGKWIFGIFILLAIGLLCFLGYRWYNNKIEDSNAEAANLTSQIEDLTKKLAEAKENNKDEIESDTVSYSAKVGKFTLTLPNKYAVIIKQDGPGEGGPYTNINVGLSTKAPGVIRDSSYFPVSIKAFEMAGRNRTYSQLIKDALYENNIIKKEDKYTFDAVQSTTYYLSGMADPTSTFFSKDGVFYQIDAGSYSSSPDTFKAIEKGFAFN